MEAYVGILPSLQTFSGWPHKGDRAPPHPHPLRVGFPSSEQEDNSQVVLRHKVHSRDRVSLPVWMPIGKPHSSAGHQKGGDNHIFLKDGGRNVQPRENAMLGSPQNTQESRSGGRKGGAVSQVPCGITDLDRWQRLTGEIKGARCHTDVLEQPGGLS